MSIYKGEAAMVTVGVCASRNIGMKSSAYQLMSVVLVLRIIKAARDVGVHVMSCLNKEALFRKLGR